MLTLPAKIKVFAIYNMVNATHKSCALNAKFALNSTSHGPFRKTQTEVDDNDNDNDNGNGNDNDNDNDNDNNLINYHQLFMMGPHHWNGRMVRMPGWS